MGSGKELQTFDQPHGFALKQAIKSQSYDFDEELSFPQNKNRNLGPIVLHACNNDEKRSDLEYELSRKEINLEKLQRVVNSGIPDGGSLQATIWKESMRNILLLFAKLNPAIGYVQGMDEILAPLYYIFSTDSDEHNAANLEADTFSCFVIIMSSCVDHFGQQHDSSPRGIRSTLSNLSELLKTNDEELWHHLEYKTMMNLFLKHSQKSPAFNLLV
ncbi:hypothetical protein HAX54_037882 [Datura stramonium]|uniref:Rab-GAP TBC domain-containing protein n=1 Tax=Datura stramonium TaxID=4076 RepID=A0ABS8VJ36_DATST|nr:hypothetical protein [Datura stramonium]